MIAGKHRGLTLAQFRGTDIRPTPDRVKESLFQILSGHLSGARVLDLFCGSGALGIEALSRGAAEVVFNDLSKESLALLEKNLRAAKETGRIYNLNYTACLMRCEGAFNLIFCDPPYKMDVAGEILELVAARNLLCEDGLVVYESERGEMAPQGWEVIDCRSYGRTKIFLFQRSHS